MTHKAKLFWALFLVFLVFDQVTKLWVYVNIPEVPGFGFTVIPGFFDVVHAENPGAAFSMFRDFAWRNVLFLSFTAVAVWVVWDQFRRLDERDGWMSAALALIASGAVGNGIDRVWKQTVTDFVRIYTEDPTLAAWLRSSPLGSAEWPSFNVADSALLVGVTIFFVLGFRKEPDAAAEGADEPRAATGE